MALNKIKIKKIKTTLTIALRKTSGHVSNYIKPQLQIYSNSNSMLLFGFLMKYSNKGRLNEILKRSIGITSERIGVNN